MDGDREAQPSNSGSKRGGWITFPFTIGTVAGMNLAGGGWQANLIVYLIGHFNVKSIDAAQIANVVGGCTYLFPIIGAIVADSFLGSFSVISISGCVSLLGIVLLALTASLNSLRPQPCEIGSSLCKAPSEVQYAVLYSAIALASLGHGGARFTTAAMGANQFDKPEAQGIFFNWYFFTIYTSLMISSTAIVYVMDSMSWKWGFGLCLAASFFGLAILLVGNRFYRHDKLQGSPFAGLARVVIATVRKRKVSLSSKSEDYYYDHGMSMMVAAMPKESFRFLNRAAMKAEGDIGPDGSIAKPWRLCSVQQVEDFKNLIRIFPLWSTGIFLSTPIAMQVSLTVLQSLTMDRHLGPHFKIPAGSMLVISFISTSIFLTINDRFLLPIWKKMTHQSPTPLQQIGLGHVLNVLSMAVSALVESKRLKIIHANHLQDQPVSVVPMIVLWLFPQLVLVGIGEAFHFPGQVALYYQEFPASLKSTATAMISMLLGIGFYLSTALIDLIRRVTGWLPDDLNNGKLDYVYWMLVVVGVLNFGYYLVCARFYEYKNVEKGENTSSASDK